jgi:hypothetical protein
MDFTPGNITQQALASQIAINDAIQKDLNDIAMRKSCACSFYQMPDVYQASVNK